MVCFQKRSSSTSSVGSVTAEVWHTSAWRGRRRSCDAIRFWDRRRRRHGARGPVGVAISAPNSLLNFADFPLSSAHYLFAPEPLCETHLSRSPSGAMDSPVDDSDSQRVGSQGPRLADPPSTRSGTPARGKKRTRSNIACDMCRARRTRCDNKRPSCSFCRSRSLICRYQEDPEAKASRYVVLELIPWTGRCPSADPAVEPT